MVDIIDGKDDDLFCNDLSDCSTGGGDVSELNLSDSSSECGNFEECENATNRTADGDDSKSKSGKEGTIDSLSQLETVSLSDNTRFQQLHEEINLLNVLMYEAEDKTEKCNSLYKSFSSEINNNFVLNGIDNSPRVFDSPLSSAYKYGGLSERSELLYSDFDKTSIDFDADLPSKCNSNRAGKSNLKSGDVNSISARSEISIDSCLKTDFGSSFELNLEKSDSINGDDHETECCSKCNIPVEDRIFFLWNQINRLKYALKSIRLSLKEQQMETLMQINEFLISQEINKSNAFTNTELENATKIDPSNEKNGDSKPKNGFNITAGIKVHSKEPKNQINPSCRGNNETPRNILVKAGSDHPGEEFDFHDCIIGFGSDSKFKNNLAINSFKIALLECSMLSSTAASLFQRIPTFEQRHKATSTDRIPTPVVTKNESPDRLDIETQRYYTQRFRPLKENKRPYFIQNKENVMGVDRKAKSNQDVSKQKSNARASLSDSIVNLGDENNH